jgi:hypothetical protein
MSQVNPGWYPDPDGKPCERYWDGSNWTLETRPKTSSSSPMSKGNSGITTGWKIVIGISLVICIAMLAFAASDPTLWDY